MHVMPNVSHFPPSAAEFENVSKSYRWGRIEVPALRGIGFSIDHGEFLVLGGPSGSGKSTLLSLLGCLDRPDQGTIHIAGHDVTGMTDEQRTDFRASRIGFVFQNFNLLPVLTAAENVEFPLQLLPLTPAERRDRAASALDAVGLGDLTRRRPAELSGGQRQRVAIARALVKRPVLVIADEPTANLDRKTSTDIIDLMRGMQREFDTTFVFSSHDPHLREAADRCVDLIDGSLLPPTTTPIRPGSAANHGEALYEPV